MLAYRVVNLHPGLGDAPAPNPSDCSTYQSSVDQAAAYVAAAQREVQNGAQSNNQFLVDGWSIASARANQAWQAAKDDLARCQAQAKAKEQALPAPSVEVPILPLVLGIGILAVGAFLGGSANLRFY